MATLPPTDFLSSSWQKLLDLSKEYASYAPLKRTDSEGNSPAHDYLIFTIFHLCFFMVSFWIIAIPFTLIDLFPVKFFDRFKIHKVPHYLSLSLSPFLSFSFSP